MRRWQSSEGSFERVLAAARGREPWALQDLYEGFAGRVHGYLRSLGAADPEDLTSEVFLRVFDHLDEFRGEEAGFRAWIFTIAHRLLIDERRRAGRRQPPLELAAPVAESLVGGDAELDSLDHIADKDVELLLSELASDQRDVLMLRVVADLTVAEVARVLGKRPGAVKALQRRGLERLRRRLLQVQA